MESMCRSELVGDPPVTPAVHSRARQRARRGTHGDPLAHSMAAQPWSPKIAANPANDAAKPGK